MRKVVLISPKNRTVYNFRGELVQELIKEGYEVIVTGPDQADVEKIKELGARFITIPLQKNGTSVAGDYQYYKRLKTLLRIEKPDVVLSYTVKPVIYGSIAAKAAGVKNINAMITGAGYAFTAKDIKARVIGSVVRRLYRVALKRADHVIFQNPDDKNEFIGKKLVDEEKCFLVNGSGVNTKKFTPQSFPERTTFLMISRHLKSKGVQEYLEAARLVKKEHPEVRFVLVGKYEDSMQDAVEKKYIEKFIREGVVERFDETEDVLYFYKACSVYVLPSYREGTPRTVLEAMACGRPIITTDAPGCRETVKDGENGYLVPVGDVEKLAERMAHLISKPYLAKSMGKTSRIISEEKFEVVKVNKVMMGIMVGNTCIASCL